MMKKPGIHDFDAHGRAHIDSEHLEREVLRIQEENERLKRIVLLQQKRWLSAFPDAPAAKPTFH